jgi:hypothetical protein
VIAGKSSATAIPDTEKPLAPSFSRRVGANLGETPEGCQQHLQGTQSAGCTTEFFTD